jgi:thiosulfate/3-mercaptopyruvate sulfurtransferase
MVRFVPVFVLAMLGLLFLSGCQPLVLPEAEQIGYAHPEALASTEWLAAHLDDPNLRILETRDLLAEGDPDARLAAYEAGHIPGAVYVDAANDISDPNGSAPLLILPQDGFEARMGRLGIDNDTTVVVYDDAGNTWSARLWWALRLYGHDNVKLLDGGLTKWMLEERALETGIITPEPANFAAEVRPELLSTAADVQAAIEDPNVAIVDSLWPEYYSGEQGWPDMRAGHIPTARNFFVMDNLDPTDATLLPADMLAERWQAIELEPGQSVITYCGAGYYGAMNLFVLYQMGFEDLSLYDGSWMEWGADERLPVETSISQIEPIIDPDSDQPIRILFVGNSDTFFNEGLDAHVRAMAASAEQPILLETAAAGSDGVELWQLLKMQHVNDQIRTDDWDVVVLQNAGIWEPVRMAEAVAEFTELIRANNAQPVLFAHSSSEDPQSEISSQIAADLAIPVAKAGLAWDSALAEKPALPLRGGAETHFHASVPGTYLNTAVIFATLFGQTPEGLAFRPVDVLPDPDSVKPGFRRDIERLHEQWRISEEDIAFLQRVAWETVVENQ